MNSETTRVGLQLLEQGEAFAWATILDTKGSSPRHAGADMLVRADGSITGTIGGGPLEMSVAAQAKEMLGTGKWCLERFDSAGLGMMCGGGGLILVEDIDPRRPAAQHLFARMAELLRQGEKGWLVTVLPGEAEERSAVRRCIVDSEGDVAGEAVHPLEELGELARRGGTYDRILADDPGRVFVRLIGARGTAYVFGAGHCGQALVPVLSGLGFFTVIVDDRSDFASPERFPDADRIVVPASFDAVVETLPVDEDSYVVIVTRGHSHDQSVLAQALRTQAGYIGMIGSRQKVANTFEALGREGCSSDDLGRVHAPIGLAIGAETPEEIAISIAAQLVQARAAKRR